jgi:magnesium and cobalt exporter, CNNM family
MPAASDRSIVLGLVIVLALVSANAFFVAAEFALVSSRRSRLQELVRNGHKKATLALRAIQTLDRVISATQLGITLASLGLGWVGEPWVAGSVEQLFEGLPATVAKIATHGVAVAIAFALITMFHIILGELVPKAIALLHAEAVAMWVSGPLLAFAWVMYYPIAVLRGSANGLLKLLHMGKLTEHEPLHSPEELRIMVEQSGRAGSLEREDVRLLEGVFEFSEKTAIEVMTPRTDMVAIAADSTVESAADVVASAGRSRYPVYAASLDDIVGVVHAKDVLRALRESPAEPVRTIMRPPLFVPGSREVEDVLADMKRLKTHLAVVLDEYGGTAGLVTMEDLLEEIVGEIYDEYDLVRQASSAAADGSALVPGSLPVSDFNRRFQAELDDTEYTTLGGFLFGQLGRLPKAGDKVETARHRFEIAAMAGRRVKAVKVTARGQSDRALSGAPPDSAAERG